jgi:hypothetical protein
MLMERGIVCLVESEIFMVDEGLGSFWGAKKRYKAKNRFGK